MFATTWVQIIKATLLMLGVATMAIWVLARFGFDPIKLLNRATAKSGQGAAYGGPGLVFPNRVDEIDRPRVRAGDLGTTAYSDAILAVVAGVVPAASGAAAHDVYGSVWRTGQATQREERNARRVAVFGVGAIGAGLALAAGKTFDVQLLTGLTFAVAASANFPPLLLALTWRRFNPMGAVVGIGSGLVSAIVLIILSPQVWSGPASAAPFPLGNPAIVSVPIGFLGCLIGTLLGGSEPAALESFDEVLVRSETGLGAEVASERSSRTGAPGAGRDAVAAP